MARPLRIFISSPSDVEPERRRSALIVDKVAKDYARFFDITFVLWETEPMLACGHFQDHITPPAETEILVLVLWSRLGTPLPERTDIREYRGIDGRAPVTGTEWEYESALAAQRKYGLPDLLAYRKVVDPKVPLRDLAAKAAAERQWAMLEAFWRRHFVEGLAAYREFEDLDAFEVNLERDLRSLIEGRIAGLEESEGANASRIWLKGNPFRGLERYQFEHAPIFFGRSEATRNAVEQLVANSESGRPFLLILGASGAGKSSLAQAGILPAISVRGVVPGVGLWRHAVVRPGAHANGPFMALAEALTAESALPELLGAGQSPADFARHLAVAAQDPAFPVVTALTARAAAARNRDELLVHEQSRLAIVVDQLEELFTLGDVTPEQRKDFIACLDGLMRSRQVVVIATMRNDQWHRAAETPRLVALAEGTGRLDLLPATPAEIAEMIRRPAEAAGLTFETDHRTEIRLDAALVEEAAHQPGALPLLSFLLDSLYFADIQGRGKTTLTYETMRALGGLKGAIAQRAESAFAALAPDVQAALPRVLRALVTVSRSGAEPTSREAPISRFAEGSPERSLIEALLAPDMRLLVSDAHDEGARVRLAHEALIRNWERARRQIAQDRDDLRTRALVEQAETESSSAEARQRRAYLLRDPHLANAIDLARRWGNELAPELKAFISHSEAAAKAAARRRWMVAGVVMLCLGGLSLVAIWSLFIANAQRNEALVAQSRFIARDSRAATSAGNSTLGMLLAAAALPRSLKGPDRPFVSEAEWALEEAVANRRELAALRGHTGAVDAIAFAPDGGSVATASADKTVRLWNARTGAALAVLQGHEREIRSVAFSPDGKRLVTASDDKTARLWDAKTGAPLAVLRGHQRDVRLAAFSPDGQRILTASWDGTARLWDGDGASVKAVLEDDGKPINTAAFSRDGALLVIASDGGTARVFDAASGAPVSTLHCESSVAEVQFSPDGARVVAALANNTAGLWNARTGAALGVLRGHQKRLNSAAFSPDGSLIATTSDDKSARLWDAASGAEKANLRGHLNDVTAATFSPDGNYLLTASSDHTARLWDGRTGAAVAILRAHDDEVVAAVFSRDGKQIATAAADKTARLWSAEPAAAAAVLAGHTGALASSALSRDATRVITASQDGTARIWDAKTGAPLRTLAGHQGRLYSAAFSPDGSRALTASADRTARLWDAVTGASIAELRGHSDLVTGAEFSSDGSRIVTASFDRTARLWDAKSGAQIAVLQRHLNRVNAAVFSPDGALVATASDDGTARLWNARTGAAISVLKGHQDRVTGAVFSADSTRLATVSSDSTARLWRAGTGALIAVLTGHEGWVTSAAFAPNGSRVLTTSIDKTARLWDGETGQPLAVLKGHEMEINRGAFSSDGSRVATASWDGTARVWDASTGEQIIVLRGHRGAVTAVDFFPDGKRLVSASEDRTARLWELPPRCQALIEAARGAVPRALTSQERADHFLGEDAGQSGLPSVWGSGLSRLLPTSHDSCQGGSP